jgi:hypothetical protein
VLWHFMWFAEIMSKLAEESKCHEKTTFHQNRAALGR